MKRYAIYRSIRGEARIFGLSVSSFAIQMIAVIGGLLLIIFSFSLPLILLILFGNIGLYLFFLRFKGFSNSFSNGRQKIISNKEIGLSSYED